MRNATISSKVKMMVKSGLESFILKSLHAGVIFPYFIKGKGFPQNRKFSNKNHLLPAERDF